jgi:arginyl-tRNA synthetase
MSSIFRKIPLKYITKNLIKRTHFENTARKWNDLVWKLARVGSRIFKTTYAPKVMIVIGGQLVFDIDLAKSQSNDNPVYYIQYAHARVHAVLEQWDGDAQYLQQVEVGVLDSEYETQLLQRMIDFPQIIETAAEDLAPHQVAFYLKELAADFHSYYNASRFLVEDEQLKLARLALIAAVAQVLRNGLALLGVTAPERM